MAENDVLLSVMLDDSAIEDQLRGIEGRKVGAGGAAAAGGQAARSAPPAERDSPAKKIDELHKTLKRLVAASLTQNLIQIRSGSIVQSGLATVSDLLQKVTAAGVVAGGAGGLIVALTAKIGSTVAGAMNELANMGKGYISGAARFNPEVMAAMARKNIADLMAEIKLSRITGPAAVRALGAETALLSDPDRISAVGKLRSLAIGATRKVTEAEHGVYNALGPAMANPGQAAAALIGGIRAGLDSFKSGIAGTAEQLGKLQQALSDLTGRIQSVPAVSRANTGIIAGMERAFDAIPDDAKVRAGDAIRDIQETLTDVRDKAIRHAKGLYGRATGDVSLIPPEWENAWREEDFKRNEQGYLERKDNWAGPMMLP